jgi:methylglutaconyl-CoA hydratase
MHRYFLSAERFSADSAHQLGLVHEVVSSEKLFDAGMILARTFSHHGPNAVSAAKELIREISNQPLTHELMPKLAERLAMIRKTKEAQEGFSAFVEKRPPNWS